MLIIGAFLVIVALYELFDYYSQSGSALVAIATIGLVIFAALQINENGLLRDQERKLHEKDRKERIIGQIVNWTTAIQSARYGSSIDTDVRVIRSRFLGMVLIPYWESDYIRSMTEEAYNVEIASDVNSVINNLASLMFLEAKQAGIQSFQFTGNAAEVINRLDAFIAEGHDVAPLVRDYNINLNESITCLLFKAGKLTIRP